MMDFSHLFGVLRLPAETQQVVQAILEDFSDLNDRDRASNRLATAEKIFCLALKQAAVLRSDSEFAKLRQTTWYTS